MKLITQARLLRGCLFWLVLGCSTVHAAEMVLAQDEAVTLSFTTPIDTVFIAEPELADYQVVKNDRLVVYGKKTGRTSLVVFGMDGSTLATKTITIQANLGALKQQIASLYPESAITLTPVGEQLVVSGRVASEKIRRTIYTMVGEYLNRGFEKVEPELEFEENSQELDFMFRRVYNGVVDNLEVAEVRQVNVKLTVAEVSQSFLRQLGVKWGTGSGDAFSNGQFTELLGDKINSMDIRRYISAADDDSLGQVLAEPNLSVISGETASFLAGGEMPVQTRNDDTNQVTFKEYGVRLELAALVEEDDKIKLTMEPEVSAIDAQFSVNGMPAFKTRRARTTIQLGDGESFILGGLLSSEDREALSKIPLAGDLPVIGALFRHTENHRVKSELIIVATVNLVKPVAAETIQLPRMTVTPQLTRYFNIVPVKRHRIDGNVEREVRAIMQQGGFRE